MKFTETPLSGCYLVELEPKRDARGHFARTYCADEFREHGLEGGFVQVSVASSRRKGTLRGLHFQTVPAMERKLIRCERGAAFDVAVDLRPSSETFGRWCGIELSEDNGRQIYIPQGFAHGVQTLVDDVRLEYQITPAFRPELAAGVRWDDPEIDVEWPFSPVELSDRDRSLPSLADLPRSMIEAGRT